MLKQIYKKLDNIEKKVNVLISKDRHSKEEELVTKKLDRIDKEIAQGKRKLFRATDIKDGKDEWRKYAMKHALENWDDADDLIKY